MKTEFNGQPVAGGTYPAGIWKTFMESVLKIDPPPELKEDANATEGVTPAPGAAARPPGPAPPRRRPATAPTAGGGGGTRPRPRRRPRPGPTDVPPAEQAPAPPTTPDNGTTARLRRGTRRPAACRAPAG